MAQLNTEHCQVLVSSLRCQAGPCHVADKFLRTSWSWRDCDMKNWKASLSDISSCAFPAFSITHSTSCLFYQIRRSDAPKRGRHVIPSYLARGQQTRQQQ